MNTCKTPGCSNIVDCKYLSICKLCYSSMLRWVKRTQDDQITRLAKLRLYEARMCAVVPSKVSAKTYKVSTKPWSVLPGQFKKLKKKRNSIE